MMHLPTVYCAFAGGLCRPHMNQLALSANLVLLRASKEIAVESGSFPLKRTLNGLGCVPPGWRGCHLVEGAARCLRCLRVSEQSKVHSQR